MPAPCCLWAPGWRAMLLPRVRPGGRLGPGEPKGTGEEVPRQALGGVCLTAVSGQRGENFRTALGLMSKLGWAGALSPDWDPQ